MVVFLVVSALSRVSSEGLDDAIEADAGALGTYTIALPTDYGLGEPALARLVSGAVGSEASRPVELAAVVQDVPTQCGSDASSGDADATTSTLLVVRDLRLLPVAEPFGGPETDPVCIADVSIEPGSVLSLDGGPLASEWNGDDLIDARFQQLAVSASTAPIRYEVLVTTGQDRDLAPDLTSRLTHALSVPAARAGYDVDQADIQAQRVDTDEGVRAASEGIKSVYGVIAWGVLVLGGLGLLVAELIVVRERTWFYGLSRAVGARRSHVIAMVFADVGVVVACGTLLAVLAVTLVRSPVEHFAWSVFQVRAELLGTGEWSQLLIGVLLLLAVAGGWPAWRATRLDPLDVLEPSGG
jgi:hypothetical protein